MVGTCQQKYKDPDFTQIALRIHEEPWSRPETHVDYERKLLVSILEYLTSQNFDVRANTDPTIRVWDSGLLLVKSLTQPYARIVITDDLGAMIVYEYIGSNDHNCQGTPVLGAWSNVRSFKKYSIIELQDPESFDKLIKIISQLYTNAK